MDQSASADETDENVQPREKRRNRRLLFTVLGVMLAVVLAAVGIVGYYAKSAVDALDNIQRDPSMMPTGPRPTPVAPGPKGTPMNIVLMGSDHRGGERGRSDVLQVMHISADRSQVFLMSIPRDTWVPVEGHGDAKINAAYSWGGSALAIQTVEQLLQVPMDHSAIIDFEGFVNVIDALGGITVYNQEASSSDGFDFPQGDITLTGEQALRFVRERKNLSDGDFGRATRQREMIKAVLSKLTSTGVVTDPGKFRDAITKLGGNFTVDPDLTNDAIMSLGWSMRDFKPSNIGSFQFPTAGFGTSSDGQSIVLVDRVGLDDLRKALRSDDMLEYYKTHQ
ncbi:LCP family protein [Tessaracoccus aquimaris]|nr:LCP family protein [Tessaracoccus aquimaris]